MLLLTSILSAILKAQYFEKCLTVSLRVKTALISAIYKKSLKLSNSSKQKSNIGEIVNLMAVDAHKFLDLIVTLHYLWDSPLIISLSLYFVWQLLGYATIAGVVVLILIIPANIWIIQLIKTLGFAIMKEKDQRIRLTNEILKSIKILKLYAWEISFKKYVEDVRFAELELLKKWSFCHAFKLFIYNVASNFLALFSFLAFVFISDTNLNAEIIFVSLSFFNLMKMPLQNLAMSFVDVTESYISIKRIDHFLNLEEVVPEDVTNNKNCNSVIIKDGNFSWVADEDTLGNINLKIPRGSLVAVVGSVGAGKSSLISAILGEIPKISGEINIDGKIAYVSQQAWIQNATVRDNIIFGKTFENNFYNKVIESCALEADFKILAAGDLTEVGEKGLNLSGGQKLRISLARAVYNNADIYLLDDPLSAVDCDVGNHIFDQIIGPRGLLKRKTRIFITHGITFLPQVDEIVLMENGCIKTRGSYWYDYFYETFIKFFIV